MFKEHQQVALRNKLSTLVNKIVNKFYFTEQNKNQKLLNYSSIATKKLSKLGKTKTRKRKENKTRNINYEIYVHLKANKWK